MNKIKFFLLSAIILFSGIRAFSAEITNDSIMDDLLKDVNPQKPTANTEYNYESVVVIPIKLKIAEDISTKKNNIYDNQEVVLYTRMPVRYKNKTLLNADEKFTANVAIYMKKGMNGIPAQIILDNFKTQKIDSKKLSGIYIKRGLNLTPLVVPVKFLLTIIPGAGTGLNFIKGGNATITPYDTVTIYYHPEWN
jgi:hypothetical protein